MPNHVTNKVVIIGKSERILEIVEFLKSEDGIQSIDFNKIIPMPVELLNTTSPVKERDIFLIAKYGSDNWYNWSINKWGTKWNAYDTLEARLNTKMTQATILFHTAWSTPAPVIQKLSEKFPDVKIKVWYADEDFGHNVGKYGFENGEVIFDESLDGLQSGLGYYSNYQLLIVHKDSDAIMADFRENNEEARVAMDENGETDTPIKWYDHERQLKEFSKKYPDAMFQLHGEGESGGEDTWQFYFKNGKGYKDFVIMTFPDFDESKMTE